MTVTEEMLRAIEERCKAASPGPWKAFVEGRDHFGGDDMIRIGGLDDSEPDMYVSRDRKPASEADLDFIASARQDLPMLVAEVRRLRDLLQGK